jgi:replicative DNA helicase
VARAHELSVPSAIETECVLLGTILTDANQLLPVVEILPPGQGVWFYQDAHRLIYDAMLTLLERHDPIDLHTVTDVLRRRGSLEKISGSVYLAELMECVATTANIAHHARIIRDKALYRGMINIGSDLTASAYAQEELPALINRMHEALLSIAGAQTTARFTTMHTLMTDTIRNAQHADERDLTGVHTGFHGLDFITNGFQPTNLVIVAARPSMGKSALALQFAQAAAQSLNGLPVIIFSLEMSAEELGVRMLCSEARVDSQRMKRGFFGRDEWSLIFDAGARLENLPIHIDATSSLSVLDVRTRAKRLQMEQGLGMIIIDYLQLMTSSSKRKENRQQEVSEISRDLKMLAKELNIPVIALSQLNREVEAEKPPIPKLSMLRDSGAVEQDADVVMFIYRGDIYEPNTENGVAQLIVAKHRNGPTGRVRMRFSHTFARFDELAEARYERLAQGAL